MKIAILLHLYQPALQEEDVFRQVASECYLPLLKLIKAKKNHKFTLNIPLSLLELMEKFGYSDWISDIRNLYDNERIELTGSSAYHALLSRVPESIMEEEVALNEYGLGYYLGSRQGFEGDSTIMIKNLSGFFPPELAVNEPVLSVLNSFDYKWVLTEETAIDKDLRGSESIYEFGEDGIKLVLRDRALSNLISFKRDSTFDDIFDYLRLKELGNKDNPIFIALDAEYFGHHYRDGIYLLDALLSGLENMKVYVEGVSGIVNSYDCPRLSNVYESSWGASDSEIEVGNTYPYWAEAENGLQTALWSLQDKLVETYVETSIAKIFKEDVNIPVWDIVAIAKVNPAPEDLARIKFMLFHKFIGSDKFWWASGKEILGKRLMDKVFIRKYLTLAKEFSGYCTEESQADLRKLLVKAEESLN
jgi:predicted glycosyl hydrolase (DUF1957 family)